MKGSSLWSRAPYRPLTDWDEEIYVCRLAPRRDGVRIEWLDAGESEYEVSVRVKGEAEARIIARTRETAFDAQGLTPETEYEITVTAGGKKSRARLFRTGDAVGTVVNYLHPEDRAYAFSGRFLCSPSLAVLDDGTLLASMDLFAPKHPQNLTLIYRSTDGGESWEYLSELMPCFWGKLFTFGGALYMLACSTEYGDLIIGRSDDGGRSFSAPVCLVRGSNGKNSSDGVHKAPQEPVVYRGRLWTAVEWGAWGNSRFGHAPLVASCALGDDPMIPENWSFTPPSPFKAWAPELEGMPSNTMTIEGTLTVTPDGRLLDVLRFGGDMTALCLEVNVSDPEAPLTYAGLMPFEANRSKFTIKRDEKTGIYYSVANRITDPKRPGARNLLSLMASEDLKRWKTVSDLIDMRDRDPAFYGFQYVDFHFSGDDLIYLSRTAINGADSYHNSNYITFHRVRDFRAMAKPER